VSQVKSAEDLQGHLAEYRARLEVALSAARIGTWTWDISNDRVRGDRNLNGMFGVAPTDDTGRPIADYLQALHPADLPSLTEAIGRAIAVGGQDQFEVEYRLTVAGRELWVCARGMVERRADGVAISLPGVVVDITRQKQLLLEREGLLEDLQRQSKVLDTTLSAINDFVYVFDLSGRFRYVNKAVLNLWGLTLEQVIGRDLFDLNYPAPLAARLQQQIQQVIDTRQGLSDETAYTGPAGVEGFYEYILSPVLATDGSVEAVAGSTRDVTARKRVEDELRQRIVQLETLFRAAPAELVTSMW
jgi:PAS domain S-box-containing protein